ncbi:MAG: replication initiation protein [Synergistaceae bacterium]|nr:replication initiation protein [Synergistaceae bacterium]
MLECYDEIANVNELLKALPYRPYCSDRLERGLMIRPLKDALPHKYIELNPPHLVKFITFDIDYECWPYVSDDVFLPRPLFFVGNRENGHAHLIYALRTPVLKTSMAYIKPLKYLQAITEAYCERLRADPMYSGLISKNPWSDHWRVVQTCDMIYDMEFLADAVHRELSRKPTKKPVEYIAGLGRNCWIFEHVRVWAYRAIRKFWGNNHLGAGWYDAVEYKCLEENAKFSSPLDMREIRDIAKSISRWTERHLSLEGFSERQRNVINMRWEKESKKTEGLKLLRDGASVKDVMIKLNVSRRTAFDWQKDIATGDGRKTLTELKPWELMGISKATWHRRYGSGNK